MSTAIVVEILLGILAAAIAITSYTQAMRANHQQTLMAEMHAKATTAAVDADAYARAKDIYEGALDTLRSELISTRSEIQTLRESNTSLRAEIVLLRAEIAKAITGENR